MRPFELLIAVVLVALLGFQIWVTVRVWKNQLFDRSQKVMQSKLVWLLPIIGAMLVHSVLSEEEQHQKPKSHLRG
ncbi:MAG TPA: hypothetical protein VKZ49_09845 [Polyangiaceae bacterium]|nr:hypothetical protein [Polyangiaceae bacterium]